MSVSHTIDPRVKDLLQDLSDKFPYQMLQYMDGTLLVNQRLLIKILEGDAYFSGWRIDSLGSGSSGYFLFENPDGSGVYGNIIGIFIAGTGNARLNMYPSNQVTVTTPGTAVTALNLNPASGKSAKCALRYGGNYTLGSSVIRQVLPGGSRGRAVGATIMADLNLRMPENYFILIEIVNQSGSSEDFSIRIIWWEESA